MDDLLRLLAGSLVLRPYVFGFLALSVAGAAAAWGAGRALAFTALAASLAFAAEFASTRIGVPFGLYHYTGVTRGQELYLANVPFFDPISFAFLAWASLGTARVIGARLGWLPRGIVSRPAALAGLSGLLMMWLDLVIDPLAVRGERWFLGRIFFYPAPGGYFGVPVANFVGWALLGAVIAGSWLWIEARAGLRPPAWGARVPGRAWHPVVVYYLVLLFNLGVTAIVAEAALFWAGVAAHFPVACAVVSCVGSSLRAADGAEAIQRVGAT